MSRLDWLEQQWAREKEARQIAERRSRAFEQQAIKLRQKLAALAHLRADREPDRPPAG
jgi:hypothetical protein